MKGHRGFQERQDKVPLCLAELAERSTVQTEIPHPTMPRSKTSELTKKELPRGGSQQQLQNLQVEDQREACLEQFTIFQIRRHAQWLFVRQFVEVFLRKKKNNLFTAVEHILAGDDAEDLANKFSKIRYKVAVAGDQELMMRKVSGKVRVRSCLRCGQGYCGVCR